MNRGKTLLYRIFIVAIMLLGIGLLAYPSVSNWWNDMHRSRAIAAYENAIAGMSDIDVDAMFERARAYNKSLTNKTNRFQLSDSELDEYNQILDVTGTGIMGYVEIPKISVKLPVYHTVEETVLQIAAGHMPGTSFPIGETGTHSVMSGHRGLPSAKLFTHLDELEPGDVFYMHVLNKSMVYKIYDIEIVLPEELDSLSIASDRDLITLVTCTPYGVNSHRILVHAERTDDAILNQDFNQDSNTLEVSDSNTGLDFNLRDDFGLILIAIFVILLLVFAVCNRNAGKSSSSGDEDLNK